MAELIYNFDKKAVLEIRIKGKYVRVAPNVFRSWAGARRVNGIQFKGDVFYFNQNTVYKSDIPKITTIKAKVKKGNPQNLRARGIGLRVKAIF